MTAVRLAVRKTQKLFIGGAFVRSESGRTFAHQSGTGIIHVARATRKDLRDAVRAARGAWLPWSNRTAYNRGQIIYRLAEMIESRRAQFTDVIVHDGQSMVKARREVDAAIDRTLWYAGWCDKIEQWLSTKNPVGLPHFNVSSPEPTGVVGIVPPDLPALLGLVSMIVPPLCAGNTVVTLTSQRDPLSAVALAEALATADVPGGVVNILSGDRAELVPHLARHMDVNALDMCCSGAGLRSEAAQLACENLKRLRVKAEPPAASWFAEAAQSPRCIERFMEIKTVWHPAGV
jgi:acyl-CoA reductase-like NAD-dependent aldehyde dehydrogenase